MRLNNYPYALGLICNEDHLGCIVINSKTKLKEALASFHPRNSIIGATGYRGILKRLGYLTMRVPDEMSSARILSGWFNGRCRCKKRCVHIYIYTRATPRIVMHPFLETRLQQFLIAARFLSLGCTCWNTAVAPVPAGGGVRCNAPSALSFYL